MGDAQQRARPWLVKSPGLLMHRNSSFNVLASVYQATLLGIHGLDSTAEWSMTTRSEGHGEDQLMYVGLGTVVLVVVVMVLFMMLRSRRAV
jgi:hypothetical protein